MEQFLLFALLGILIGGFGTLIGAGGGFILMPILVMLYPKSDPDTLTSISLAVVFCNALSGSAAYARMKRIDYRAGIAFAIATIPGAILGAMTTYWIPRRTFTGILGVLLVAVCVFLLVRPSRRESSHKHRWGRATHRIIDASGEEHLYTFSLPVGVALSVVVGFVSSLLGIGGGIIHVPAMTYLLDFPVHIATATSHFVLAIMALAGTAVHVAQGTLTDELLKVVPLGAGAIAGAQLGANVSKRIHGTWIIRALAVALGLVGLRILLQAVGVKV